MDKKNVQNRIPENRMGKKIAIFSLSIKRNIYYFLK